MNLWLMRVCVACLGFATIFGLLVVLLLALGDLRDIWHAKFGENMLPGRTPCNASSEATKLGRHAPEPSLPNESLKLWIQHNLNSRDDDIKGGVAGRAIRERLRCVLDSAGRRAAVLRQMDEKSAVSPGVILARDAI